MISEETPQARDAGKSRFAFLVDPLDGTREFLRGSDEYTVNIALLDASVPTFGVVYAPSQGVIFAGTLGVGSRRAAVKDAEILSWEPIRAAKPTDKLRALISHSHLTSQTREFLDGYRIKNIRSVGSSLKFCLIAAGEADFYPRLGPTMEWDTAAGEAVLCAAGGAVLRLDGQPLKYLKRGDDGSGAFENPWFVAAGAFDPYDAHWHAAPGNPQKSS